MAKVLLIDDDHKMRMLVSEFLSHHGHEVIIAQDGAFGVSMSALEYPDLIILDMMMPVMSGPEALDLLKREPGLAGIPVVVASAIDDPEMKQQMLDAGVVAYLDKPIDLQALLSCVDGTLRFRSKPR